jgi:uncharacterized protein YigE (DUF2233 family)
MICCRGQAQQAADSRITWYVPDVKKGSLQLFYRDDGGMPLRSLGRVKQFTAAKGKKLIFAMNGGMYQENGQPLGLAVLDGKTIRPLNRANAPGNFYLKPNGVFYLDSKNKATICKTENYKENKNIRWATQSGPMLVIDGKIHPAFSKGSANVHIRNGVGILPDGRPIFAISGTPVNLYDFALFFQQQGCSNALYLDGFVSRMYLPEKGWQQEDGRFGIIIGFTAP